MFTNLGAGRADAKHLYEELYCVRGDMENRKKEQQLSIFADRTSYATLKANQVRLYFASFAYVLIMGCDGWDSPAPPTPGPSAPRSS